MDVGPALTIYKLPPRWNTKFCSSQSLFEWYLVSSFWTNNKFSTRESTRYLYPSKLLNNWLTLDSQRLPVYDRVDVVRPSRTTTSFLLWQPFKWGITRYGKRYTPTNLQFWEECTCSYYIISDTPETFSFSHINNYNIQLQKCEVCKGVYRTRACPLYKSVLFISCCQTDEKAHIIFLCDFV